MPEFNHCQPRTYTVQCSAVRNINQQYNKYMLQSNFSVFLLDKTLQLGFHQIFSCHAAGTTLAFETLRDMKNLGRKSIVGF